jgi:hypothetical protein
MTPIWQIAGVEDHRGVRMAQLRHGARFEQKPVCNVSVAGKLTADDFHCYRAFEAEVRGKVDSAHAARADLPFNSEPAGDNLGDIHF